MTEWKQPIPFLYPSGYEFDNALNKETYKTGLPVPTDSSQSVEPASGSSLGGYPDGIYWPPYDKYYDSIQQRFWEKAKNFRYVAVDNKWRLNYYSWVRTFQTIYYGLNPIFPCPAWSGAIYYNSDSIKIVDLWGVPKYELDEGADIICASSVDSLAFLLFALKGNKIKVLNMVGQKVGEMTTDEDVQFAWARVSYYMEIVTPTGYYKFYPNTLNKTFVRSINPLVEKVEKDFQGWLTKTNANEIYFSNNLGYPLAMTSLGNKIFVHTETFQLYNEYNLGGQQTLEGSIVLAYHSEDKTAYLNQHDEYKNWVRPIIIIGKKLYKLRMNSQIAEPYTLETAEKLLEYEFNDSVIKVAQNKQIVYVLTRGEQDIIHCFKSTNYYLAWSKTFSSNAVDINIDRANQLHISFADKIEIYRSDGVLRHTVTMSSAKIAIFPACLTFSGIVEGGKYWNYESILNNLYGYNSSNNPMILSGDTIDSLFNRIYDEEEYFTMYDRFIHELRLFAQKFQMGIKSLGSNYKSCEKWGDDSSSWESPGLVPYNSYPLVLPSGNNVIKIIWGSRGTVTFIINDTISLRITEDELKTLLGTDYSVYYKWVTVYDGKVYVYVYHRHGPADWERWNEYHILRFSMSGELEQKWEIPKSIGRKPGGDWDTYKGSFRAFAKHGEEKDIYFTLQIIGYDYPNEPKVSEWAIFLFDGENYATCYKLSEGSISKGSGSETGNETDYYLTFKTDNPENKKCLVDKYSLSLLNEEIDPITNEHQSFYHKFLFKSPSYHTPDGEIVDYFTFPCNYRFSGLDGFWSGGAFSWGFHRTGRYFMTLEGYKRWIGKPIILNTYQTGASYEMPEGATEYDYDPIYGIYYWYTTKCSQSTISNVSLHNGSVRIHTELELCLYWGGERMLLFINEYPKEDKETIQTLQRDTDDWPKFLADSWSKHPIQVDFSRI